MSKNGKATFVDAANAWRIALQSEHMAYHGLSRMVRDPKAYHNLSRRRRRVVREVYADLMSDWGPVE